MNNACVFSPDRRYRYTLRHEWNPLFGSGRYAMFIGLNPSTADEHDLDPTLRRIRGFADREGFGCFVMTNLFAFRATDPKVMKAHPEPVGPDNDHWLAETARGADLVVAAWGTHGAHLDRQTAVARVLGRVGCPLLCLGVTGAGFPKHPLYLPAEAPLTPWQG